MTLDLEIECYKFHLEQAIIAEDSELIAELKHKIKHLNETTGKAQTPQGVIPRNHIDRSRHSS